MYINKYILTNAGTQVGKVYLPTFNLKVGNFICIHWLLPYNSIEEKLLDDLLFKKKNLPSFKVGCKIARIKPIPLENNFWHILFNNKKNIFEFLSNKLDKNLVDLERVCKQIGIDTYAKIYSLSLTQRVLVSIEVSYYQKYKIILLDTAGLDPVGVQRIYQSISEKLDQIAVLHLSYPTIPQRNCYLQASHVEAYVVAR